jgi:poly [ADP-ribose] polymerase
VRAAPPVAAPPPPREKLPPIQPGSALLRVDPAANQPSAKIFVDSHNLAYNTTCNAVDLAAGTNKFYKMQLLQLGAKRYVVFKAWGRVGADSEGAKSGGSGGGSSSGSGKSKRRAPGGFRNDSLVHEHGSDLAGAQKEFNDKFRELTRMSFATCEPPCQVPGGYAVSLIPGQRGTDAAEGGGPTKAGEAEQPTRPCTLTPKVAEFVESIFSHSMMRQQLEQQEIDLEKMPLGSISALQVKKGYQTLNSLASQLATPEPEPNAQYNRLLALTTDFYTAIPHKFSLDKVPPVIDSEGLLKAKLDMVESLLHVSESQRLSQQIGGAGEHPTDALYRQLKCGLEPASEKEVQMVREYTANTHGSTHATYSIKVTDVLRADRAGEADAHQAAIGNRQLLWHGSRLTNWAGILSQGLRIAPPEAPVTGYMFGKGATPGSSPRPTSCCFFACPLLACLLRVPARAHLRPLDSLRPSLAGVYFADSVSKSANYCMANRANNRAVLLLCDVALGEPHERITAEFAAAASSQKAKKDSTWGIGKHAPDEAGARVEEDIKWPMGKCGPNAYLAEHEARLRKAEAAAPALMYNEFIVYDVTQVKMKYVVVCDLQFI